MICFWLFVLDELQHARDLLACARNCSTLDTVRRDLLLDGAIADECATSLFGANCTSDLVTQMCVGRAFCRFVAHIHWTQRISVGRLEWHHFDAHRLITGVDTDVTIGAHDAMRARLCF